MPLAFLCFVAIVTDGDTFVCGDGTKIRLAAVDAAELRPCRKGRVCAPGNPHLARQALVKLAAGKTLQCTRTGTSWGRITAWCRAGAVDLSCAQYKAGLAIRLAQFDRERRLCRG